MVLLPIFMALAVGILLYILGMTTPFGPTVIGRVMATPSDRSTTAAPA